MLLAMHLVIIASIAAWAFAAWASAPATSSASGSAESARMRSGSAGAAKDLLDTRPLDGLRGLAALYIVLFHYLRFCWTGAEAPVSFHVDLLGQMAVNLFYLISGFVLAFAYVGAMDVHSFYVRRISRIMPLFYFSNFYAIAVDCVQHLVCEVGAQETELHYCRPALRGASVSYIALLRAVSQRSMHACFEPAQSGERPTLRLRPSGTGCARSMAGELLSWGGLGTLHIPGVPYKTPNGVAWTVSVFLVMYLVYPAIARWLPHVEPTRVRATALTTLCLYAALQLVAAPMGVLWAYHWAPLQLPMLTAGSLAAMERLDAAAAARRGEAPPHEPWSVTSASAVCGLLVSLLVAWHNAWSNEPLDSVLYLGLSALPPAFYMLLTSAVRLDARLQAPSGTARSSAAVTDAAASTSSASDDAIVRLLCCRPLTKLGEISLAVYLLHVNTAALTRALDGLLTALRVGWSPLPPSGELLVALGMTLVLGWGATVAIERPAARACSRLLSRRKRVLLL